MLIVTKRLKITGVVQGVGFRYSLCNEAKERGLTGWVRNCRDGSVEAVVQGPPEAVDAIIEWARKGPSLSQVDGLDVTDAQGRFSDFQIEHSV